MCGEWYLHPVIMEQIWDLLRLGQGGSVCVKGKCAVCKVLFPVRADCIPLLALIPLTLFRTRCRTRSRADSGGSALACDALAGRDFSAAGGRVMADPAGARSVVTDGGVCPSP